MRITVSEFKEFNLVGEIYADVTSYTPAVKDTCFEQGSGAEIEFDLIMNVYDGNKCQLIALNKLVADAEMVSYIIDQYEKTRAEEWKEKYFEENYA